MSITIDTSGANRKGEIIEEVASVGSAIASRWGAAQLAAELRVQVPYDTGRLEGSIRVVRWKDGYAARIPESDFPRWFYPVKFFDVYRRVAATVRGRIKKGMAAQFKAYIRNRFR